jgi:hypothetical protein
MTTEEFNIEQVRASLQQEAAAAVVTNTKDAKGKA